MSEKPQTVREDESEDLLEQIITQGLEKMNAPAQVAAAEEASKDESPHHAKPADSGESGTPPDRKNKRSAVYLYLLILFGAAFLMLLLAYFIQQRSSKSTISDLKDSMNLSREQLLEQIRELEDQLAESSSQYDKLERQYDQLTEENKRLSASLDEAVDSHQDALHSLYLWEVFWDLDQYYQAKDYESCIAPIFILQTAQTDWPPNVGVAVRELEILDYLILNGYLDSDYQSHLKDYADLMNAYTAQKAEE